MKITKSYKAAIVAMTTSSRLKFSKNKSTSLTSKGSDNELTLLNSKEIDESRNYETSIFK
jgi:hypothetical protein